MNLNIRRLSKIKGNQMKNKFAVFVQQKKNIIQG